MQYNVWYFFNLRFDTLSVNMILLKIMANTVWTTTLVHQCSCLWFFVSCPNAYCPNSKLWNRIRRSKKKKIFNVKTMMKWNNIDLIKIFSFYLIKFHFNKLTLVKWYRDTFPPSLSLFVFPFVILWRKNESTGKILRNVIKLTKNSKRFFFFTFI